MKKKVFLIVSAAIFFLSWNYYQRKSTPLPLTEQSLEEETFQEQKKIRHPEQEQEVARRETIKRNIREQRSKKPLRVARRKETSTSHQIKDFNEKKMAIADEKGNLYPTDFTVTKDFIVAYGDLIVGTASELEAVKNGEKVLSVPLPILWPKGVIPIVISEEVRASQQSEWIQEIAQELKELTKIEIRIADLKNGKDKARVYISRGTEHCYAQVGHTGVVTHMSLSSKCSKAAIYHEFFHILGFYHEQNRFDREEYLKILWENIDEKYWPQFKLFPENSFNRVFASGGHFDFTFQTIMIYGSSSFSSNGDYSMVRDDGTAFSSEFKAPTAIDIARLKQLYQDELTN